VRDDGSLSTSPRVVITGVSRGIGRAVALRLAADGAWVAGVHNEPDPRVSEDLAAELVRLGGRSHIRIGDTRSTADVDALAAEVADQWGGIDGWVNNAARILVRPFLDTDDTDWDDLLDTNLLGYVRGARAAARVMVPAGAGAIVNVGSAVDVFPPTEMSAYVTAKGGITGLTRALAVELGPLGVRVNAVAPGATETPLNASTWNEQVRRTYRERIPLGHIAGPAEIAAAVVMLLGPDARYVTGQVLLADGGLTLNGSVGHQAH